MIIAARIFGKSGPPLRTIRVILDATRVVENAYFMRAWLSAAYVGAGREIAQRHLIGQLQFFADCGRAAGGKELIALGLKVYVDGQLHRFNTR